jgi:hypothetical protein
MTTTEKFNELNKHIGWEQVGEFHMMDDEMEMPRATGKTLAKALVQNAQNQTGIELSDKE